MSEIAEGPIGNVGKYDIEFKEGKLVCEVSAQVGFADAGFVLKIGAEQVLDAIAKAIPGTIDDAVIDMAKKLLAAK